MRYLLYCILGSLESQSPIVLVGVDGQPVCLVSNNGLSAAVSRINEATITPEISRLLAYKEVIETFHNDPAIGGVIPMRYGCVLEERSQVIQILRKRRVKYISLLKELESCVEMGMRILISDCGPPWRDSSVKRSNADKDLEGEIGRLGPSKTGLGQGFRISDSTENRNSKIENPQWKTPGHTYLGARKAYYAQEEKFNKQVEQVTERCCSAFNGLFRKYKTEFPSIANFQFSIRNPQSAIRNPFPSIYFLVPRDCLDRFREVFRQVAIRESTKLLLSGPWPPYNFVQLEYSDRNESMIGSLE